MTRPALVLVHGGSHAGDCWDPTVEELRRLAPEVQVLAVDLPGRRSEPGDLATLTIEQCVDAVVRQIDEAGLDEVVLVGHSMAGLTVPGVVERLGARRVRRLVLLACCVPEQGTSIVEAMPQPLRAIVARAARRGGSSKPLPGSVALMCNGMSREQKAFVRSRLYREASGLSAQRVDRSGLPDSVPRTWILTLRDRALRPSQQRSYIANIGGVEEVIELDTCHDAMVSSPAALAALLEERCRGTRAPGSP